MILPYVYKLTHKVSNQYYIGFRKSNQVKSIYDLGFRYFSSSKQVKNLGFENFYIEIIAEFFDSKYAFEFEQNLIKENFKDPLCLNRNYNIYGNSKFDMLGLKVSNETRVKISIRNKGKLLGDKNPMFGKQRSYVDKRKSSIKQCLLSDHNKIYIYALYKSGMNRNIIHNLYKAICSLRTIDRTINKFKNYSSSAIAS